MSARKLAIDRNLVGLQQHRVWLNTNLGLSDAKVKAGWSVMVREFVFLYGGCEQAAVALNEIRGSNYKGHEVGIWRRGTRRPPEWVREVMRTEILRSRFGNDAAALFATLLEFRTSPQEPKAPGHELI